MTDSVHILASRIVVAVDSSFQSTAALEAAVDLASDLDLDLLGLFVEDTELLKAAEVPFSREVHVWTGLSCDLDRESVRLQISAQSQRARVSLEAAVRRSGARRWEFRTVRGNVVDELLSAATESDLLMLGKTSLGSAPRRKLGSTARRAIREAKGPVMIVREGLQLGRSVVTLYDGTHDAAHTVRTAAHFASGRRRKTLKVLVWAPEVETRNWLQSDIAEQIREQVPNLTVLPLESRRTEDVARRVCQERAGLLVIPLHSKMLEGERLTEFLYMVEAPVVLVR